MPTFNGQDMSVEAHRIALQIHRITGCERFAAGQNVANVKTQLRQLYVATGGKRGPDGYEPNMTEYRSIYNGATSGAYLLAASARKPEAAKAAPEAAKPVESEADIIEDGPAPADVAKVLKDLLGPKINPEAVKRIAVEAVNWRLGELETTMAALVAAEVARSTRNVEVKVANLPAVKVGMVHKAFQRVLRYAANRKHVMMVGPAGSGKTTMAEKIAEALAAAYYFSGKCVDEVKLLGYMDGGGSYRTTQFRQAYEFGGVFLADEMDGWAAEALIAVNAALAGRWGDFPDGKVARHPDFVCLAAANTFGRGADRQYVGREQLDGASLDRFAVVVVDYDEDLERAICNSTHGNMDWLEFVVKARRAVEKEKVRHIVSPRASIEGGVMLAAGESRKDCEEAYIWKGLEEPVKNRVLAAMR